MLPILPPTSPCNQTLALNPSNQMAGDDTIITNTTPTSTNKIIPFNIPIRLSLKKHNYTSWCSFLKIHLGSLGLKTHIEGSSTNSNDPEWDKQDDLVKDHIKDLFHDNKDTRAITLDGELRSIKLGSLTINDYCTKIKAMADRLANLGEKVSDKNLAMYALNGLDTWYKGIARLIRHSQPLTKFEIARNMLLLKESNLQEATDQANTYDSSSSSPTVLMATKTDTKGTHTKTQPLPQICNHFNKGSYKFGDWCKFIHDHRNQFGLATKGNTTRSPSQSPSLDSSRPVPGSSIPWPKLH
nr:hybrid signal transduction histidine kinase M [Tanacetum cinerariifolium]